MREAWWDVWHVCSEGTERIGRVRAATWWQARLRACDAFAFDNPHVVELAVVRR